MVTAKKIEETTYKIKNKFKLKSLRVRIKKEIFPTSDDNTHTPNSPLRHLGQKKI